MHDEALEHISQLGTVAQSVNFHSPLNMSRRKQPCPQQVQGKDMPTTIDSDQPDVYFDTGMNTREPKPSRQESGVPVTKSKLQHLREPNTSQLGWREMISAEEKTSTSERRVAGVGIDYFDGKDKNFPALPGSDLTVYGNRNLEESQERVCVVQSAEVEADCIKQLYLKSNMKGMDFDNEPSEQGNAFIPRFTTPPGGDENNRVQQVAYESNTERKENLDDSDRPLCIEEDDVENGPTPSSADVSFVKYHKEETSPPTSPAYNREGEEQVANFHASKMFPSPVLIPEETRNPDAMAENESPTIDNKNSEIQLLKEQVKMIQQQHQYQIQMIHYLQLQMSMITQQRQHSEEPKPPAPLITPGGTPFNPLSQLLANTNKFGGAPDLASSVANALSEKIPRGEITSSARQSSISPPSMRSKNTAEFRQHPMSDETGIPRVDQGELMIRALHQQRMQQNSFLMNQQQARQPTLLPEQVSAMLQARERFPGRYEEQNQSFHEEHRQSDASSFVSKSPPMQNSFAPNSTNKLQRLVDNIGDDQTLVKNQCKTCRRVLSCPSALKLHYRTHTGERPYQCDLCSRAFTTRGNLRTHYSSVHRRELPPANVSNNCTTLARRNQAPQPAPVAPVNKLTCPLCSDVFDDHLVLTQHMQMHALASRQQQQMLAIQQQQQEQQQQQQQQQRLKSDNSPLNSPPSNAFKPSVSDAVDLSYERRASENSRSPNFDSDAKIKQEQRSPMSIAKIDSTRAVIKEPFNALDLTRASPQERQNEILSAPQIEEKTAYSPSFNEDHRSTMHQITPLKRIDEVPENLNASGNTFSCDLCSARFDFDEDLKDHLLRHENSLSDSPISNNSGSSYNSFPRDGAEAQQGSFKRAYEEGSVAGEPDLKRSNLRHWCDICKKQFSSASSLQIHNRTHTGEKPFSCNVCGRAFTTKGNLKVHMGTHVWGAGGSRRGRRVSMDNPVMSSWMKNSTNVDSVPGRNGSQPPSTSPTASAATAAIYQQYAALAQGLMNRSHEPGRYPASNAMMNLNPAALAASRLLQQQAHQAPVNTEGSPEGRTETSLSSDGENDQIEAPGNTPSATAAHEWLWKVYQQRSQGQVN